MKILWWLIRFIGWFVVCIFVLSLLAKTINLHQISLQLNCNCHDFHKVIPGEKVEGYFILICSFVFAFCIAFLRGIWKPVKRMAGLFLVPFGVYYLLKMLNLIIERIGAPFVPTINFQSHIFISAFVIIFLIYSIVYGIVTCENGEGID
jgi:hypothetical protein